MAIRPALQDEHDTQSAQCKALGADLYTDDDEDDYASPSWGADPFCILAALEEESGTPLALS